jgi:AraC family transcriptional regulator
MKTSLARESGAGWKRPFLPASQGAEVKRAAMKSWSHVSANVKELRLHGPFQADLKHDCARLSVMLDVIGDIPDARPALGRPTPPVDNTIHQMNYTPAGMQMWACSERTTYLSHVNLLFAGGPGGAPFDEDDVLMARLPPRFMFFDERLLQLAKLFCTECHEEGPSDLLYGDSLATAIAARMARLGDPTGKVQKLGGLPDRQLKRVTAYMVERLAFPISLGELANLIGTSRSYFGRAFRISTGVPPHRWVMLKRLEAAQEYLLNTQLPIAQIAPLAGFTHQAHLTRVFRRFVGASPHAWRRLHGD